MATFKEIEEKDFNITKSVLKPYFKVMELLAEKIRKSATKEIHDTTIRLFQSVCMEAIAEVKNMEDKPYEFASGGDLRDIPGLSEIVNKAINSEASEEEEDNYIKNLIRQSKEINGR